MKDANFDSVVIEKPNWTVKERKVIDEFVHSVRASFKERARRIVLYGSRARGDADDESDYDFLVLLDKLKKDDQKILSQISWEVSYEHCVLVVAQSVKRSEITWGPGTNWG
jgi:predicted nucleotidyltransferase